MRFLYCILPFFVLFVSNCKSPTVSLTAGNDLSTAAREVVVSGQQYTLSTTLWRDFQPISPPDGKPLTALVNIIETGSRAIPTDLKADSIWVMNGDEIWGTLFSSETRPENSPHILEKIARDGPKWGPDIAVDVVVRLVDSNEKTYLLRADDQMIGSTY